MSEKDTEELVAARIDDWRKRLIDLSFRNRLINYKPTKSSTLEVRQPAAATLLADVGRDRPWSFYMPPEPEEQEEDAAESEPDLKPDEILTQVELPKRLEKTLETMARRSNGEFIDKGIRVLYLAVGFLDWTDPVRRENLSSPLVLVPVELKRESVGHPYKLHFALDEEITINPALTIRLEEVGLDIPGDWAWEDKPLETELGEIREAVAGAGWSVRDDAVIGFFQFQKLVMYRDLLKNEERVAAHPLVRGLARRERDATVSDGFSEVPSLDQLDEAQAPHDSHSILDADSSQRRCIEAAKRGCSFVVQGPPGTGKSQTIANMIAEALGQGKRVLFISEKVAALDVVHKRLARRGLADYCLKLHGRDAARKEVVSSLHESLTHRLRPGPAMASPDLEKLDRVRSSLNETVDALHSPSHALLGRSAYDVYGQLATLADAPAISGSPAPAVTDIESGRAELDRLRRLFETVADAWSVATDPSFSWRGFAGESFTAADEGDVQRELDEIDDTLSRARAAAGAVAHQVGGASPDSIEEIEQLIGFCAFLRKAPPLERLWLSAEAADAFAEASEEADAAHRRLSDSESAMQTLYAERHTHHFSPAPADRLGSALEELELAIGRSLAWESNLCESASALVDTASVATALVEEVNELASSVAASLGQPDPGGRATPAQLDRLADLANLAFTLSDRPDRLFLVPAGVESAAAVIGELGPVVQAYQQGRAAVLADYRDSVFSLDLEAADRKLTVASAKRLGKLSADYRAQVKDLREHRLDGRAPEDPAADVKRLLEVQQRGRAIDAQAPRLSCLGAFNRGCDTDLAGAQRAVTSARQVLELAAPEADLDAMAAAVAVGSTPNAELAQRASTLKDRVARVRRGVEQVREFTYDCFEAASAETPIDDYGAVCQRAEAPLRQLVEYFAELRPPGKSSLSALQEGASAIQEMQAAEMVIDESGDRWAQALGSSYLGDATDWNRLRAAGDYLREFFRRFPTSMTPSVSAMLEAGGSQAAPATDEVETAVERAAKARDGLTERFDPPQRANLDQTLRGSSDGALELTSRLRARIDGLPAWCDLKRARRELEGLGWGTFLSNLEPLDLGRDQVTPAFERSYWSARLQLRFDECPALAEFRGQAHQRRVDEFRQLDDQLVATAATRVIEQVNGTRPNPVATGGSEVGLLTHEAKKKKRHLPVRTLIQRLTTLVPALKPCLMMSPLTVSHYLSAEQEFDLVIFDEASQVSPWDAINCIYRGKQLIVAGDSKQLPPTSFFALAELGEDADEEDEAAVEETTESILDLCETVLPSESLTWHYRSRHEHLIAFSNHNFYGNRLLTFPGPEAESQSMGVRLVHVADGVYDRARSRTNREEAKVVAERVLAHLQDESQPSVGVVAFSVAQSDAIRDELDLLRAEHPELEERFAEDSLAGVFVKNLESVQGDERDVMIFSIGYGRDEYGKFSMSFGPLNGDGGPRRLNVAVTRARTKVEVVSSVRASDFDLSSTSSPGPRLLRAYLDFAEHGPAALAGEIESMGGDFESPFEEAVAGEVRAMGYDVISQVGVAGYRIDLGVVDPRAPGRFLVGIECDGATYHSSPTARDRDRLRQEVLEDLGWSIYRIWSWDWVREHASEVERLRVALKELETRLPEDSPPPEDDPSDEPPQPVRDSVEVVEVNGGGDAAALPWVEPYHRAELISHTGWADFHDTHARPELNKALMGLLSVEAPIHVDYAIKRLAETHGIARRGANVVATGKKVIQAATRRGEVERRGSFLWLPGQELEVVRTVDPEAPEERRSIVEIPPEEIDLAIEKLTEATGQLDEYELVTQVARVLGFRQAGSEIRKVIRKRINALATAP